MHFSKRKLLLGMTLYVLGLVALENSSVIQNNVHSRIAADAYFYSEMDSDIFDVPHRK